MGTPEAATLSSGTMATITATARTIYAGDAPHDHTYSRAKKRFDKAARKDFAAPGTIADAVMVVVRGQRRDLR